jgi:hypothetical protein
MLIAGVGYAAARDLGLCGKLSAAEDVKWSFGKLHPLVELMQETPVAKLLPRLADQLKQGTTLRELVCAGALANARVCGGEDYIGFHTMMAMYPAFTMSQELPTERQPLAVFKVLYRNTKRIQEMGGKEKLEPMSMPSAKPCDGAALRELCRRKDMKGAEQEFAAVAAHSMEDAFNAVLHAVQDSPEVHRVVLPYRARDLVNLLGPEHAHTMLRQSVHYCVNAEGPRQAEYNSKARAILPKLLDAHKLGEHPHGTKAVDDGWVGQMCQTIFRGTPEQAAEAAAAALAEGIQPDAIGEAICLAANQLILRDNGRPQNQSSAGKPVGSVHGDSIGVHACDSANAWRNMAKVSNPRNQAACLILGAYQAAKDRTDRGGDFFTWEPYPRRKAPMKESGEVIGLLEESIRGGNQADATAWVQAACEQGVSEELVFKTLLRYAVSEDGALHAEKYYRTVREEFASSREPFRWRHLLGLARVTASEHGKRADGYDEACGLLGVKNT